MRDNNSMRTKTRELIENASVSRQMRETWQVGEYASSQYLAFNFLIKIQGPRERQKGHPQKPGKGQEQSEYGQSEMQFSVYS